MQAPDGDVPSARPALIMLGMLVFLLPLTIVLGYALPSPAALVAPAAVEPLEDLIKVDGAAAGAEGHIYLSALHLTTEPRLGQYLLARLQSDVLAVPKSQVVPASMGKAEFQRLSQRLLAESQRIAEIVALRQVGAEVKVDEGEVRVLATIPGTPATLELRPGDVIATVDGEPVHAAAELVSIVQGHIAGEELSLRVEREGRTRTVTLPALRGPLDAEGPVLGTVLGTSDLDYEASVSIEMDAGELPGGPAAGLMYALGVYNAVATEDITRGHRIAGSGTLRLNGAVGPVDGIALKARAAEDAGAEFFLAAAEDAPAACAAVRSMQVIPVRTFDEALTALRQAGSGNDHGLQVVPPGGDTTLASLLH